MEPRPYTPLPVDAEMTLRQAWEPDATPEVRGAAGQIGRQALKVVLQAACENQAWLVMQLRSIGIGEVDGHSHNATA